MTADLRRLAEQATDAFTVDGLPGVSVPAQAILTLLDERDRLEAAASAHVAMLGTPTQSDAEWARVTGIVAEERDNALARVAALEEGLGWVCRNVGKRPAQEVIDKARALLDPAAVMGSAENAAEGTGIGPAALPAEVEE